MNNIVIVGFAQATTTRDIFHIAKTLCSTVQIVEPDKFFSQASWNDSEFFVSVIQDENLRQAIIDKFDQDNLNRATLIHSTAYVDETATINPGTLIGPFCSVFSSAVVKQDCIVGPYSLIGHKTTIKRNCIINPGTMIAGSVTVGENCRFGVRSTVVDKITIGDNILLGAGAVVSKNLSESGIYLGSPARKKICQ
jgi:sugar O-acyltransferase (sialic acid O-acetyltransferase NeuD family)